MDYIRSGPSVGQEYLPFHKSTMQVTPLHDSIAGVEKDLNAERCDLPHLHNYLCPEQYHFCHARSDLASSRSRFGVTRGGGDTLSDAPPIAPGPFGFSAGSQIHPGVFGRPHPSRQSVGGFHIRHDASGHRQGVVERRGPTEVSPPYASNISSRTGFDGGAYYAAATKAASRHSNPTVGEVRQYERALKVDTSGSQHLWDNKAHYYNFGAVTLN